MKMQVYPEHCNFYQKDGKLMMHGGELFKMVDRQAAIFCKELLKGTDLIPLTVGIDKCQYYYGPLMGETLEVKIKIDSLGKRRITLECQVFGDEGLCFKGYIAFCSFNNNYQLCPHNLGNNYATSSK